MRYNYRSFLFILMTLNELFFFQRASWYNYGEIKEVVNVIKSLLTDSEKCEPRLHAKEIGVMAPWREQVWKLREQLRKESLNAVDVGTVEVSAKPALLLSVNVSF
jgi:superfamily I DNA and/or RNA helicase